MSGRTVGTRLARAQARSEAARARFSGTLSALQHRASPQILAQDVAETLKQRGMATVRSLVDTAKRKPVHVGLALALAGLFLARHEIARRVRRRAAPNVPGHSPTTSPKRGPSK